MNSVAEPDVRYFEHGTALHRVLQEAAYIPRCSDNKTATRTRPREFAVRYPYMQINRPGLVSWLIFDLDHANSMIWEDAGLPAPNLIVRNRASGNSHLYYAITPVCTTEAARDKPIAFMKAVYAAFSIALRADPNFHSGPVAKTPGHPWWSTEELHNSVYELGALADYVDLAVAAPWAKRVKVDDIAHSRHCLLFEHLRHYAYSIVNRERQSGSYDGFVRWLDAKAHELNRFTVQGFAQDLPLSSLKATIRSIARWTWTNYTGSGRCKRGIMQLDPELPLPARQTLAAERTHSERQKSTADRIRAACRLLRQRGESLTQMAIGRIAGVTRQTVATYKTIVEQARQALKTAEAQSAVTAPENVKFATHQVPAVGVAFLQLSLPVAFEGDSRETSVVLASRQWIEDG
ncbi:replication initiation protein [Janthinobacterium psychrotolerans]|uniref:Primase C terminal 1 (PriCT-1) n=1 Tax=Janthinobacterium psychrotolerans TaxID=1747903 RepID=A0A1A7C557_9BURK|nr:replication initiation protein [Janthinobacterium psychrotolerans]OBV41066.1 Primase C terminal 1 (PriCT-1) [Janthinobacterium psychrotolerans]